MTNEPEPECAECRGECPTCAKVKRDAEHYKDRIYLSGGVFFRSQDPTAKGRPIATFEDFALGVRRLLEPTAAGKGYNQTGADGPNELFDFVEALAGGYGHALGEIVYKARRFASKGNPEDVLKIAAWAFLIWRHKWNNPLGSNEFPSRPV